MERPDVLKSIIEMRMKIKSELEGYRMLTELRGTSYERQINELLDRLNRLDELEKELRNNRSF
jgi:hypothetical protein